MASAGVVTVGPNTEACSTGYVDSIAGVTNQQIEDQAISNVISWYVPTVMVSVVAALTFILLVMRSNVPSMLCTSTRYKALLKVI